MPGHSEHGAGGRRVLVTGASGFVGRACLKPLADAGFEVHGTRRQAEVAAPVGCRWHRVDLLDEGQVRSLMATVQPTHLLHLAWYTEHGRYADALENYDWVGASLGLFRRFRACGGRRVVAVGSCYEYDLRYGYCTEGLTPTDAATAYGRSKAALAALLPGLAAATGLSAAWARPFFLYGPNESPMRLVPSIIRPLLQRRRARCSIGTQVRDYLHVDDLAAALVMLVQRNVCGPINIGSGAPVTVGEVVRRLAEQLDGSHLLGWGEVPMARHEPSMAVANIDRLRTECGWEPRYDLDAGLAQTVAWWRARIACERLVR